jgi:hypothetical protein
VAIRFNGFELGQIAETIGAKTQLKAVSIQKVGVALGAASRVISCDTGTRADRSGDSGDPWTNNEHLAEPDSKLGFKGRERAAAKATRGVTCVSGLSVSA